MTTIELTFALSAPARRALQGVCTPHNLEFVAERFFDKLENERYREFAVAPDYYTNPRGHRCVRSHSFRRRGEKLAGCRTRLTIKTFRRMKKFQVRGLALTWQLEEILYFGFREGLINDTSVIKCSTG